MTLMDATIEKNRLLDKGILSPSEEARLAELKEIIKSRRSRFLSRMNKIKKDEIKG